MPILSLWGMISRVSESKKSQKYRNLSHCVHQNALQFYCFTFGAFLREGLCTIVGCSICAIRIRVCKTSEYGWHHSHQSAFPAYTKYWPREIEYPFGSVTLMIILLLGKHNTFFPSASAKTYKSFFTFSVSQKYMLLNVLKSHFCLVETGGMSQLFHTSCVDVYTGKSAHWGIIVWPSVSYTSVCTQRGSGEFGSISCGKCSSISSCRRRNTPRRNLLPFPLSP